MTEKNKHIGSSCDDLRESNSILAEVKARVVLCDLRATSSSMALREESKNHRKSL